jgi:hypothetical protein
MTAPRTAQTKSAPQSTTATPSTKELLATRELEIKAELRRLDTNEDKIVLRRSTLVDELRSINPNSELLPEPVTDPVVATTPVVVATPTSNPKITETNEANATMIDKIDEKVARIRRRHGWAILGLLTGLIVMLVIISVLGYYITHYAVFEPITGAIIWINLLLVVVGAFAGYSIGAKKDARKAVKAELAAEHPTT